MEDWQNEKDWQTERNDFFSFKSVVINSAVYAGIGSQLLTQYCSGDKIEKNEMGRACSTYGERRGVYRVLVGKPEGKRPLGRPRHRWEENINPLATEFFFQILAHPVFKM
jgi:hypothetical protein